MKKAKGLLFVSASIALIAIAYYILIYIPKANKEKQLQQARTQATTECQKMVDQARSDYSKIVSLNQERINRGFNSMVTDTELSQYQNIFTPQWFQGCIARTLQNWGYTAN